MIIDPWGEQVGSAREDFDVISATVTTERLQVLRSSFPVLSHRRLSVADPEQSHRRPQT